MSTKQFLESWSHELTSRARRVRNLIGDAHWPSDGFHKEHIVRESLSRIIQPPVYVSAGFIRSSNGAVSPEVDLLIFSSMLGFPYFREGDLAILPPELALGAIEIKSKWSSANLNNILTKSVKTQRALGTSANDEKKLWSGAIFFEGPSKKNPEKLLNTLGEQIRKIYGSNSQLSNGLFCASLPKTICIIGTCVIFVRRTQAERKIRLSLFEAEELSFAVQVSDLLGHIHSVVNGSTAPLEIEQELNLNSEFKCHEHDVNFGS